MKNKRNIKALNLILLVILSLAFMTATAQAQSTSQSSPTALTAAEFSGKGPNKETIYYFNFTGGAGEVSVALDIKAKQYSTFARLELLDAELNTLATHNMNAATSTGNSQVLKKITLGEKQTVLLKITLDGNLAEYKITLGGAVETGNPATEDGSTNNPDTETSSQNEKTVTDPNSTPPTTGGSKIFNLELGKFKIGNFINLPKSGTLVIQMKDGSTQEINLSGVKSLTVKQ